MFFIFIVLNETEILKGKAIFIYKLRRKRNVHCKKNKFSQRVDF